MANYGIAMGFRPAQIENPVNQLAKVLQIQGMQDQQSLNRLQADEYRRKVSDTTAINEAWRGAVGPDGSMNRTALIQRLASGGQGSAIPGVQKQFLEADKAQGDLDHRKLETAHKRVEMVGQGFGWLRQQPTLENARVLTQGLVRQGIAPPEMAQQMLAEIEANPTPENISRLATMAYQQALSAKDQLPKYETRDLGGQTVTQATDPVSGRTSVVGALRNSQSPNNAASVGAQYAIAQSNRDAANINAQGTRDAARIKDQRDTEMKLGDDYRAQSKGFKEVADAHKIIEASLQHATTSAAATLAGATKFMKLLDPGSVVRESELGMALAATGVFDRATNYYNTLRLGRVLTPQQAADFKNIAGQIYQAAQQQQQMIDKDYRGKAEQYQLRPDMVLQDLGQNAKRPSASPNIDALLEKYK
jgi:hypothetical protein